MKSISNTQYVSTLQRHRYLKLNPKIDRYSEYVNLISKTMTVDNQATRRLIEVCFIFRAVAKHANFETNVFVLCWYIDDIE